jgi:hypothetical protein
MRGVLKTSAQAPIAPEKWQHIVETSDFTFAAAAGPGATPASESSEETLGTQPKDPSKNKTHRAAWQQMTSDAIYNEVYGRQKVDRGVWPFCPSADDSADDDEGRFVVSWLMRYLCTKGGAIPTSSPRHTNSCPSSPGAASPAPARRMPLLPACEERGGGEAVTKANACKCKASVLGDAVAQSARAR